METGDGMAQVSVVGGSVSNLGQPCFEHSFVMHRKRNKATRVIERDQWAVQEALENYCYLEKKR